MTIIQTNIWICEDCGKVESTCWETSAYSDPVVSEPRQGWDIRKRDDILVCPECMEK